jgi:hypothetical protein
MSWQRVSCTHGRCTASARQTPAAPADCKDLSVDDLAGLQLERETIRTETSKVCELGGVITHGANQPIRRRLPDRIEETEEHVEDDLGGVSRVVNVHPVCSRRSACAGICPWRYLLTVVEQKSCELLLLIFICPGMNKKDEDKQTDPAKPRAQATGVAFLVKEEPEGDRTENLGNPIDKVV